MLWCPLLRHDGCLGCVLGCLAVGLIIFQGVQLRVLWLGFQCLTLDPGTLNPAAHLEVQVVALGPQVFGRQAQRIFQGACVPHPHAAAVKVDLPSQHPCQAGSRMQA